MFFPIGIHVHMLSSAYFFCEYQILMCLLQAPSHGVMVRMPSYESTGVGLNPHLSSQRVAHPTIHPPFRVGQ